MTNGTVLPSHRLMEALAANPRALMFVNDYGPLSPRAAQVAELCAARGVRCALRVYYGPEAHCGGWFDLGLLSGHTLEGDAAKAERFRRCQTGNNPRLGLSFGLYGGDLFACSLSGIAARLGLLTEPASVDLCDDGLSLGQKRAAILALQNRAYLPACAVCRGNDGAPRRFAPAEQRS
jgi:hypothetical protein